MKRYILTFNLLFSSFALNAQINYLQQDLHTADPSAHWFENTLYIYPSHDIETGVVDGKNGAHYNMKDYYVYSLDLDSKQTTNHGKLFGLEDVPWAKQQLWAPDVTQKKGKYYFYFPAKDKDGIFRIGLATSKSPKGPFKPEKTWIEGTYSIDPTVYEDNGKYYLYFGGIQGGQLQYYKGNQYQSTEIELGKDEPAFLPRVAQLSKDMKSLAEAPKEVKILDENGKLLKDSDKERRFFEGVWIHRYNNKYYLSYSTGTTHKICYAIGDSPYGPFTYQGVIMTPVKGWTTHHSIIEVNNEWYIFYHDTNRSGKNYLRDVKYRKLTHLPNGNIQTMDGLE